MMVSYVLKSFFFIVSWNPIRYLLILVPSESLFLGQWDQSYSPFSLLTHSGHLGLCQGPWCIWSWVLHKCSYGRCYPGTSPGQNSINYICMPPWVSQARWCLHYDTIWPRCWASPRVTVFSFGVSSCFGLLPCCLPFPPLCSENAYSAIVLWSAQPSLWLNRGS